MTDLRQGAGKPAGTLKVALAHTVGREFSAPLLGEFVRRYPEVAPTCISTIAKSISWRRASTSRSAAASN